MVSVIRTAGGLVMFTFPIVWIGLMVIFESAWSILYLPFAFGFVLWASQAADLLEYQPSVGWREHFGAILGGIVGGPLAFGCFIGVMWFFSSAIDTISAEREYKSRCERSVITPYEYHRC